MALMVMHGCYGFIGYFPQEPMECSLDVPVYHAPGHWYVRPLLLRVHHRQSLPARGMKHFGRIVFSTLVFLFW